MKIINKKISLEDFKSHLPGIIPSYDMNGNIHYFTLKQNNETDLSVNYGLLPCNIIVEKNPKLGKYSGQIFSHQELVKIFHQFDYYYKYELSDNCVTIPNIDEIDLIFYHWLIDNCFPLFVFQREVSEINIISLYDVWHKYYLTLPEVIYWSKQLLTLKNNCNDNTNNLQKCCNCKEYEKMGGDIILTKLTAWLNKTVNKIICSDIDYNATYEYTINDDTKTISLPILKTIGNGFKIITFHTFKILEKSKTLNSPKYIKYGEINEKEEFKETSEITITNNKFSLKSFIINTSYSYLIYQTPKISVPLNLTNSLVNIGEMISLSEDWKPGHEYNKNLVNADYDGGVVVFYNDENWILKSYNNPGFIFSETYKEIYFGAIDGMVDDEYNNFLGDNNDINVLKSGYNSDQQWEKYLHSFPKINSLELKRYTYKNSTLILNPNHLIMSDTYEITTNENGFYFDGKTLHYLLSCEYVTIKQQKYQVFYTYSSPDNTIKIKPYIFIDYKKIFLTDNDKIMFDTDMYIINGRLEKCPENKKIDGYVGDYFFTFQDGFLQTDKLGEFVVINELKSKDKNWGGYTTYKNGENYFLKICTPYEDFSSEFVSGKCESLLSEFYDAGKLAIDNVGNTLEGSMPYKEIKYANEKGEMVSRFTYISTPQTNDWLTIPYIPKTIKNLEEIDINDGKYWGDIIDSLTFTYTLTVSSKKIDNTTESPYIDICDAYEKNILKTWKKSGDEYEKKEYIITHKCENDEELKKIERMLASSLNIISNIKCAIEYYKNTMLILNRDGKIEVYKKNDKFYGIKYIESFSITNDQCPYHFTDLDIRILNYWKLEQEFSNMPQDVNFVGPIADFEFIINPFKLEQGFIDFNQSNPTFYKVNETANTVEISRNEVISKQPIYIQNNKKYFSFNCELYDTMNENYHYYCIINDKKNYAQYDKLNDSFIFADLGYKTNGKLNYFIDDENGLLGIPVYCEVEIKMYLIHTNDTFDTYFDNTYDMSISPLIIDENKLGYASLENVRGNIYINRGVSRAIDFHLRLLESKSLESLEQIGNGFFKFN